MNPYHEAERIELRADRPLSRKMLHAYLKSHGFRSIDDFYVLPRRDQVFPWQSEDIVVVDVTLGGKGIYETQEDVREGSGTQWDALQLKYPMASVPAECLPAFLSHAMALASHFDLVVWREGREAAMEDVAKQLTVIADALSDQWFDPGSESLALLIATEYPRR